MTVSSSDSPIHIVMAADTGYAMPMCVAICSVAWNCSPSRSLKFTIIQTGFTDDLRVKVERSLVRTGFPAAHIEWIDVPPGALSDLVIVHKHMSPLIYARLLIPDLVSNTVARVLYLDSDIVVTDDISELWDTDMDSKSLCAVRDRIGTVSSPGGLANFERLGIRPDTPYFNSGVLLIDLERWRSLSISARVFDYLRSNKSIIQMGDQDGLNAILHDDWLELAPRWNWQITPRPFRKHQGNVAKDQQSEKTIIHFITAEKPWLPGCTCEERKYFFAYVDKTEWVGWRVHFLREVYTRIRGACGWTKALFLHP